MSTPSEILLKIQEKISVWKNFDSTQIIIKFLPSMSNVVYLVQLKPEFHGKVIEGQPKKILYREFSKGLLDVLINRKVENELFQFLADRKLGPKLNYVDSDIRIEEFIEGCPLTGEEMIDPHYQMILMKEIPKYHTLKPTTISRDPPFITFIYSMKMHELIENKRSFTNFTDSETKVIESIIQTFNKEFFEKIKEKVEMPAEDLVVSHNDLLNGNIMKMSEDSFMLIDYEYMSFNYPGYDIANYCNECMIDYSYPEKPNFRFIKERRPTGNNLSSLYKLYIINFESRKKEEESLMIKSIDDVDQIEAKWSENKEKYDKILEKLLGLHKYNLIISHLYWLLWGIVVSKNPKINFDYIEFSRQRHLDILELLDSE